MSNRPTKLRLDRPLRGLRPARGGSAHEVVRQAHAAAAETMQRAEERHQSLDRREDDLARREQALAERERELEEKLARLGEMLRSAREEREQILEASEEEIVSFSLSITEKVLQCEIENGRYKIGEVVRSTLQAVRQKGSLIVRVNPQDLEMTEAALEKLGQAYGTSRIKAVPDESIPLASCCIETGSGKVFSEIPGRLERIRQSLLTKNGETDDI